MRIILEPQVFLVARPQLVESGFQAFLESLGLAWPTAREGVSDAETIVELGGRCCYMSFGDAAGSKTNEEYIRNLVGLDRDGPAHGSVCEHPHFTFMVVGASRGFSHELVRHRVGVAYSQLSTRYCAFDKKAKPGQWEPAFTIPALGQLSAETVQHFESSFALYAEQYTRAVALIERDLKDDDGFQRKLDDMAPRPRERRRLIRKAARGAARELLPIAVEAVMTFTCNARAIWNMAYLRANGHAEAAIRNVFVQIVGIMEREMPSLFNDVVYREVWDGSMEVGLPRDKL